MDVFGIFVLARPCDLTLIELSHLISVYNWNHDTVGTYGMVPTVPWSRRYRSAVTVETDSEFSAYAPEPPQQGPVRHLHHMACSRRNSRATQAPTRRLGVAVE